jgi:hypothetical protein
MIFSDVGGEGGEAVVVVVVVVPVGMVPSPCLNDAPCVSVIIDLLPKLSMKTRFRSSPESMECGLRLSS